MSENSSLYDPALRTDISGKMKKVQGIWCGSLAPSGGLEGAVGRNLDVGLGGAVTDVFVRGCDGILGGSGSSEVLVGPETVVPRSIR